MDEAYVSPRIKVEESPETPGKFVCAESRDVVVWSEEENYLFRLNEFKEPLQKWLTESEVRPPLSGARGIFAGFGSPRLPWATSFQVLGI